MASCLPGSFNRNQRMKKTVIAFLIFFIYQNAPVFGQTPHVPRIIEFAGLTLKLNDAARKDIQADVDAQYRSASHFQVKLDRVNLYLPIVERVLREEGVPEDFKFLVIQESSLISDAVSTSNAVGFWQFKKGTAEEVFLRVDNEVDERKSIVSATRGAARYLKKHQKYLDNWATTLVSYQMGLGGARRYYKDKYKGHRNMDISRGTYWYLKKFLAHKIAYQGQLGKMVSNGNYLHEYPVKGPTSLKTVAKTLGVSESHLKEYNKWCLRGKIPDDKTYTITYILNGIVPERPLLTNNPPSTNNAGLLASRANASGFPKITGNLGNANQANQIKINGIKGIIAIANSQSQLAIQAGISEGKLRRVNDLKASDPIQPGAYYYTKNKKSKAKTPEHVVQPGETLWEISQRYGIRMHSLMAKNRIYKDEQLLPGMVLRLRKYYKKDESIKRVKLSPAPIQAAEPEIEQRRQPSPQQAQPRVEVSPSKKDPVPTAPQAPKETKETYQEYQVKPGDTLYSISRAFAVKVEELRRWNNIGEDNLLSVGQKLEIRK